MVLRATKQSRKLPAQKCLVDSVIKPLKSGFSEGLAKKVSLQSMKKQGGRASKVSVDSFSYLDREEEDVLVAMCGI